MPRGAFRGPALGGHPLYKVWHAMLSRCLSPGNRGYYKYGARGISVCQRWRDSFTAFLADMGPRPSAGHSIDRINNDGNYDPGNCRWATRTEQQRNRRCNRFVTSGDATRTISEWSEITGLDWKTIAHRIERGWAPEDAVSPIRRQSSRWITAFGETLTVAEWSRRTGLGDSCIHERLRRGMTGEAALARENYRRRDVTAFGETHSLSEWARDRQMPISTLRLRLGKGVPPESALTRNGRRT